MGAEDFRITAFAPFLMGRVLDVLQQLPNLKETRSHDPIGREISLTYDDGNHLFECEVRPDDTSGTRVSLRFAICHPTSVDAAFTAFAIQVATALGARIEIRETVPKGMPFRFSPPSFNGFAQALGEAIAAKRRDWILDFGAETAAVLPEDAVRRFILKKA